MVQDVESIIEGEYYTIYYATSDMSSLQTMYGIVDFKDENSVLFKSLDQSSYDLQKIRYNQYNERSKELWISSDSSRYTKEVDVYDCIPWKSTYEIQCFAHHWNKYSGTLVLCMPGFDINPISKPVGDDDEFELSFEDGTSINFSGEYKNSDRVGSLIFKGKDVLENKNVKINNNIRITELCYSDKSWFTEQVPFSEDANGFRIQIDSIKNYDSIRRDRGRR